MRERALPPPPAVAVVTAQLGRPPQGRWWVEATCRFGFPQVIGTSPTLDDGTLFPTLYWLTCPWLVASAGKAESGGAVSAWASRLAADPSTAHRMRRADECYREKRAGAAGGADPCSSVGIAGQRDPTATKCLHAHVAAALAGLDDPVGIEMLVDIGRACPDGRCAVPAGEAEGLR